MICKVCGVEITGRIGDYAGWTRYGCPFDEDQPVDEYPCEEEVAATDSPQPVAASRTVARQCQPETTD